MKAPKKELTAAEKKEQRNAGKTGRKLGLGHFNAVLALRKAGNKRLGIAKMLKKNPVTIGFAMQYDTYSEYRNSHDSSRVKKVVKHSPRLERQVAILSAKVLSLERRLSILYSHLKVEEQPVATSDGQDGGA